MSECILFIAHSDYPHKWCTDSTVWLLHRWCHVKLLPSWHKVCVLHSTMHQFTVSLHSKPHRVHVCLAVTCHLHFWQNGQDLLHATAVTQEWNWYWNKSQLRKLTVEKKMLPLSCWDSNPGSFDHVSDFLTAKLSLYVWHMGLCVYRLARHYISIPSSVRMSQSVSLYRWKVFQLDILEGMCACPVNLVGGG